jgi:hypothetical protein
MAKWNYLTYNRICHDSFPILQAISDAPIVLSEATSEATSEAILESNVAVAVVAVLELLVPAVMAPLPLVLHRY